jgi:sulfur relay (sulfurtransferase) DsrC/TusE family protein
MTEKILLTEEEWELIEAIRNYRNSQHNPSEQLEYFVIKLFENLLYAEKN